MQSNKGRFKCPNEAQAVWNFYAQRWTMHSEQALLWYCKDFEDRLSIDLHIVATQLHKARLINGTIYDEYGRIEDKDLANTLWQSYNCYEKSEWPSFEYYVSRMVEDGIIQGTIFY